jgi:solute carrier family 38 (sodium-coupled neutral amino acid transporter), member 11
MPDDDQTPNGHAVQSKDPVEESRSLLRSSFDEANEPSPASSQESLNEPEGPRPQTKRQSSLSQPRHTGTPRTTHRVRFDVQDATVERQSEEQWIDQEDYLNSPSQHAPLLTDITPPSQSPFLSDAFQAEDHLPNARPKSGMSSAIMNMANSIIGAGIIGQPYAFRQAGMTMGIILLVGLTITVDWTIRLIIINSKLSGADSFQGTMQHCFGKSGLIAISVAQWAFAFGGMVAFCIIVGDTIPHVTEALIPGLKDMKILWLLTDRRAVIVLFILGISWPLSLYRDIAKVGETNHLDFVADRVACESIHAGADQYGCHPCYCHHAGAEGRRRSQRKSQRSAFVRQRLLSGCGRYFIW